ncbi:hypothetical protein DWF00_20875 [Bosea caraganae]|uniref:DMT family transporter n=1 Tax=Bosea caraganae TaxID=2763117 RepID=A0A370KYI0_9HYPH|nr:hypothetical protein [Bosea caraganae]RDJ19672.1 hypothetical protein DWE98_28520 [Bosea caraganae]RDJ23817.1 hypothetical protein DWF00_20875 [Bosea caraganae]
MSYDQSLVLLSVALQSLGKVLYGTFLDELSLPLFLLSSFGLTAVVFVAVAGFRVPEAGRGHLLLLNLWSAASFVGFFFALRHLPPAVVASIELCAALLAAIVLASVQDRLVPRRLRLIACAGIAAGCLLLCRAEIGAVPAASASLSAWLAIAAALLTGLTSTLSARESKVLATAGWKPAQVLAHRFYLTIAIAAAWLALEQPGLALPQASSLLPIMLVAAVGVLAPLLLLQVALRRSDALTVMICFAAQPLLSFLIAIPSPAYEWDVPTLFGVIVVTLFLGLDILAQRKAVPAVIPVRGERHDRTRTR